MSAKSKLGGNEFEWPGSGDLPLRAEQHEGVEEVGGEQQLRGECGGVRVGDGVGVAEETEGAGVVSESR